MGSANDRRYNVAASLMMTSSNGNIFRVTGHLCEEFTGPRWIPRTKASDAELWCFLWVWKKNGWVNSGDAGDLRRYRVHYDVRVMPEWSLPFVCHQLTGACWGRPGAPHQGWGFPSGLLPTYHKTWRRTRDCLWPKWTCGPVYDAESTPRPLWNECQL